jgi:hypothetical protein
VETLKAHPVLAYFVLAYVLTWLPVGVVRRPGRRPLLRGARLPERRPSGLEPTAAAAHRDHRGRRRRRRAGQPNDAARRQGTPRGKPAQDLNGCINPRAGVVAQQFRDDLHAAEAGEAALPEPLPLGRTSPTPPDTPTHASVYSWAAARTARPAGRNSGPTRRRMSTRSKPTLVHQSVRLMVALLGGPGARARR